MKDCAGVGSDTKEQTDEVEPRDHEDSSWSSSLKNLKEGINRPGNHLKARARERKHQKKLKKREQTNQGTN